MGSLGAMAEGSRDRYFQARRRGGGEARARGHRGARALPRQPAEQHPPARRRAARGHGLLRRRRTSPSCARSARFVRITHGGPPGEPRPRRDHHQGSPELPDRVSRARDAPRSASRPDPDPRLRLAVHAADRAPGARAAASTARSSRRTLDAAARRARWKPAGVDPLGRARRACSTPGAPAARPRSCSSSACRCSASATACSSLAPAARRRRRARRASASTAARS